jgi:hypothetical protein
MRSMFHENAFVHLKAVERNRRIHTGKWRFKPAFSVS